MPIDSREPTERLCLVTIPVPNSLIPFLNLTKPTFGTLINPESQEYLNFLNLRNSRQVKVQVTCFYLLDFHGGRQTNFL